MFRLRAHCTARGTGCLTPCAVCLPGIPLRRGGMPAAAALFRHRVAVTAKQMCAVAFNGARFPAEDPSTEREFFIHDHLHP